jgi:t-SNARE complex subunit (syntaxin)
MPTNRKQLDELAVGGGATGQSMVPGPVTTGKASRPQDKIASEPMVKAQNPAGTPEEETDVQSNVKADGNADANAATIKAKPSAANESHSFDSSELIEAFGSEELTEEFKEKVSLIFNAALTSKLDEEVSRIENEYEDRLAEEVETITSTLTESVDKYLTYAVQEWAKNNEVAIESTLRSEITESFIEGLKNLFTDHYISVPTEQLDVMETLAAKVEELESMVNEKIDESIELKKALGEAVKVEVFAEVSEGLASTQVEKLKSLTESVEFTEADEYKKKITTIKESFFRAKKPSAGVLTEEADDGLITDYVQATGSMAQYVSAISKTAKV